MCKCVRDWEEDAEVTGDHRMVAITCDNYIESLEDLVASLMKLNLEANSMVLAVTMGRAASEESVKAWAGVD